MSALRAVAGGIWRWLCRNPVGSVFLVALAARFLAIAVLAVVVDGVAIPDEAQYLDLVGAAATGRLDEGFWPGYGESLYVSIRTFSWPLTALFWLFGPHRVIAQLLAALFGAVAAGGVAMLGLRWADRQVAVGAGLVVAFLPSQVLFSSVALRESMVWAGIIGALVLTDGILRSRRNLEMLRRSVLLGVVVLAMFYLRQQTALLVAWCTLPAALVPGVGRRIRVALLLSIALDVPWAAGLGPGGLDLVERAIPRLGVIRSTMSIAADSVITPVVTLPPEEVLALVADGSGSVPPADGKRSSVAAVEVEDLQASLAAIQVHMGDQGGGQVLSDLQTLTDTLDDLMATVEPVEPTVSVEPVEPTVSVEPVEPTVPEDGSISDPGPPPAEALDVARNLVTGLSVLRGDLVGEDVPAGTGEIVELMIEDAQDVVDILVEAVLGAEEAPNSIGAGGALGIASRPLPPTDDEGRSQFEYYGTVVIADNSMAASLSALPRGLVAFLFRPFLWEIGGGLDRRVAGLETVLWAIGYVLWVVGLWGMRRHPDRWLLSVVLFLTISVGAAVTQGNVGTAFRHRDQLLVVMAVPVVLGARRLVRESLARSSTSIGRRHDGT